MARIDVGGIDQPPHPTQRGTVHFSSEAMVLSDLALLWHFVSEVMARDYGYERRPEPDLVMDTQDSVREFREGGLVTGSVAPVYLFNMLLLCGAIKPGATVVDLGCGPANLLVELALMHPEANFVGVDLSEEMLRCAEALRDGAGARNLSLLRSDFTSIDALNGQSADLVMSTLSLHHLPTRALLDRCLREAGRLIRPGGQLHLMDFGALKRSATTEYFARERARNLSRFLAEDYRNSLYAAFRKEDLESACALVRPALPAARVRATAGVPFLAAITTLGDGGTPSDKQSQAVAQYWARMAPDQRKDFRAIRTFFALGGMRVCNPASLARTGG